MSSATRTAATTNAAVATALLAEVEASEGARGGSRGRPASVEASFTSRASSATVGSVHRGWSLNGAPARTETYSIRQAPSSGARCAPTCNSGSPLGTASRRGGDFTAKPSRADRRRLGSRPAGDAGGRRPSPRRSSRRTAPRAATGAGRSARRPRGRTRCAEKSHRHRPIARPRRTVGGGSERWVCVERTPGTARYRAGRESAVTTGGRLRWSCRSVGNWGKQGFDGGHQVPQRVAPLLRSGLEAVPAPSFGEQVPGVRRIGLELAAQGGHVHAQVVALLPVGRAPDLRQQAGVIDHLAGVAGQHFEQVPLGGGELDVAARGRHPARGQVDGEVGRGDRRFRRRRSATPDGGP